MEGKQKMICTEKCSVGQNMTHTIRNEQIGLKKNIWAEFAQKNVL
jgi:hypothetical protein